MSGIGDSQAQSSRSDGLTSRGPQPHPAPVAWRRAVKLPGGAGAPARARGWVVACLGGEPIGMSVADVALIVSELVTNSVVHARVDASQLLQLTVASRTSGWRITVSDPGCDSEPRICARDARIVGGVGLRVVDQMCTDWGTSRDPGGARHVWCDLPPVQSTSN
jgi:serine/threonine-protein kinase RsbW